jgi:hypothetical protein
MTRLIFIQHIKPGIVLIHCSPFLPLWFCFCAAITSLSKQNVAMPTISSLTNRKDLKQKAITMRIVALNSTISANGNIHPRDYGNMLIQVMLLFQCT